MTTRRAIMAGTAGLLLTPIVRDAFAQDAIDPSNADAVPPLEVGKADFSGVWSLNTPGVKLVGAAPDLSPDIAKAYVKVALSKASDIDDIFKKAGGQTGFVDWFNAKVAGQPYWENKSILGTQDQFTAFWDQYLGQKSLNLLQFIAYMSVFINEVDGKLVSTTERYGCKGHPGIAYLFDTVTFTAKGSNRSWTKRSYNTGRLNHSAGLLFKDGDFNKNHVSETLGDKLHDSQDAVWMGDQYPAEAFPTSGEDPKVNGYILSADFFKFRGRGLIQTTWRENYRQIVDWMVLNPSASSVVQGYVANWRGLSAEEILTATTAQDWDQIFEDPDKAVLCAAIRLHDAPLPAEKPAYSTLAGGNGINGKSKGSLILMGRSIGGSEGYGDLLKGRVRQICESLGSV